jgi:hypothetical protein
LSVTVLFPIIKNSGANFGAFSGPFCGTLEQRKKAAACPASLVLLVAAAQPLLAPRRPRSFGQAAVNASAGRQHAAKKTPDAHAGFQGKGHNIDALLQKINKNSILKS